MTTKSTAGSSTVAAGGVGDENLAVGRPRISVPKSGTSTRSGYTGSGLTHGAPGLSSG
jgi:hypothetical protein